MQLPKRMYSTKQTFTKQLQVATSAENEDDQKVIHDSSDFDSLVGERDYVHNFNM